MTTLDVPTLKNVKVAVETFDALHIARDNRHLVLNRADDEVGINADKVEGILGMPVDAQIVSSLDIAAATNAGSPVIVSDPEHQLSAVVRQLASDAGRRDGRRPARRRTSPRRARRRPRAADRGGASKP